MNAIGQSSEAMDQGGGEEPLDTGGGENGADVGQECEVEVRLGVRFGGEQGEGFGGEPGPVAAGDLANGEEGTPVIGEAIESARRHGWIASRESVEIVLGPAGKF